MTKEEKKAIEYFKKEIEQFKKAQESADKELDDRDWFRKLWCELQNDIDKRTTVLNLIQNLQEENKKLQEVTNFLKLEIVAKQTDNEMVNICMQEVKRHIEEYRNQIFKILESE